MRTDRIRIARLIARLNIGGPAQHVIHLTARLPSERFESVLLTGREGRSEGNMRDLAESSGVKPVMVPGLGRRLSPLDDLRSLVFVYRFLRWFRPHVVHTHTAKAGAIGRIAARLASVPVVLHTYHGHVFQGYFSPVQTRVFLVIERRLARFTDRILTVSGEVRSQILDHGIGTPDRVSVMPLGLDLEPFLSCHAVHGKLRSELGVGDSPLVGIVARLVRIKRHEYFLEAAARVARQVPSCRFLVIGDGERRSELEALAQHVRMADQVMFLGWRRDLDRVYADLDLVVLCSENEGSPVSLIEAMAAGCVVVATRVGGVPDIVEHSVTGLLVPPADPEALAEAIVALLADPVRRARMGEAGRKCVHPAYSAARLVSDMDHLYLDLLERHRD